MSMDTDPARHLRTQQHCPACANLQEMLDAEIGAHNRARARATAAEQKAQIALDRVGDYNRGYHEQGLKLAAAEQREAEKDTRIAILESALNPQDIGEAYARAGFDPLASPSTPSPAPHPQVLALARAAEVLLEKLPPETGSDPDYGFD